MLGCQWLRSKEVKITNDSSSYLLFTSPVHDATEHTMQCILHRPLKHALPLQPMNEQGNLLFGASGVAGGSA